MYKRISTMFLMPLLVIALIIPVGLIDNDVYAGTVGAKRYTVPGDTNAYDQLQGGGIGSKYAFFISVDNSKTKEKCLLSKAKVQKGKWKTIKKIKDTSKAYKKKKIRLNHGNDLTYDSTKKKVVIVSKRQKGKNKTKVEKSSVTLVNPTTLKPTKQIALGIQIYCIAYNKSRNQYVAGKSGGTNFYILDSNFNKVKEISGQPLGNSTSRQGADCDNNYIYFLQNIKSNGKYVNVLMVYTWDGTFVKKVKFSNYSKEGEHIFHKGTKFYMGFNHKNGKSQVRNLNFKIFKIQYNNNGGTGSMSDTYVEYGVPTKQPKSEFYSYYQEPLKGWHAYRQSDQKWCYNYAGKVVWYKADKAPQGATKRLFSDGGTVSKLSSKHGDVVTMYAQYEKRQ